MTRAALIFATTLLAALLSAHLTACGGGDPEPQKTTQPLDCREQPEACK